MVKWSDWMNSEVSDRISEAFSNFSKAMTVAVERTASQDAGYLALGKHSFAYSETADINKPKHAQRKHVFDKDC